MEYRQAFHRDVFIDLVCFRRLGHNEADEPMVTQPLMYKRIAQHPGTRRLYADALVAAGVVKPERGRRDDRDLPRRDGQGPAYQHDDPVELQAAVHGRLVALHGPQLDRAVRHERCRCRRCRRLRKAVTTVPEGFKLHSRVEQVIADRRAMGEGKLPLDWGMGETLAYATLLNQGYRRAPFGRGHSAAARSRIGTRCCTTRIAKNGTPARGFRSST